MNSGDWVESMTALVEDFNGNWRIIYHTDLLENENEEESEFELDCRSRKE